VLERRHHVVEEVIDLLQVIATKAVLKVADLT
jgi:hypothetical protein